MLRKLARFFVLLLLLFPFVLWVIWLFSSTYPMRIMILDKTVLNTEGMEHRSFNWVLNSLKITKENEELYDIAKDYYGFFPLNDFQYYVNDLTQFNPQQLDSLTNYYEMGYFTDTYGIYHNEWYREGNDKERSELIYGGLHKNDYEFMKQMIEKKKTLITEFSLYALPTSYSLRQKTEELLHLRWTGWVGRYFSSLDTVKNDELPPWVWRLYRAQHGGHYPFKEGGLVFVHTSDVIVILDETRHLDFPIPIIYTPFKYQQQYELPENIIYPFWFAVTLNNGNNDVISAFSVKVNHKGDSILDHYNIPSSWIANVQHLTGDSTYYYFSADFCDNQMGMMSSKMKGIRGFRTLFYSQIELENRKRFFWEYYIPMIKHILIDHSVRRGRPID